MVPRVETGSASDISEFRSQLKSESAGIGRPLTEIEADRLTAHYRLLLHWGRRMNLTGLRERRAIIRRHFLEPIAASRLLIGEGSLLDLGSGNGFPAVPLAVLHPSARLTMVEAAERKSAFLWTVLRELGLKSAQVVTRRACRRADLGDFLPATWITFRGVKAAEILDGDTPELLVGNGRLLAFVSRAGAGAILEDPPAGLRWIESVDLPWSPDDVVAVLGSSAGSP